MAEDIFLCGCGGFLKQSYVDSIGTAWFRCDKCGRTESLAKIEWSRQKSLEALKTINADADALAQLATDPKLEQRFLDDVNRTVKHDNHVVLSTFHAGLSAYADPYNIALKAISGAGKSYGTTETTAYFPESDVVVIGSQSPKVVSHDYGELMTGNDEPLDLEDAPVKPKRRDYEDKTEYLEALTSYKAKRKGWNDKIKDSYHLIKLDGKIYHFLETISLETFQMFKSTLSHDAKRIPHKYVDDRGKVHVTVLEGSPAAIFNSVDQAYLEEFATRTFTATPNTSKVKIGAANELSNLKKSYPFEYEEDTKEKKLLKALIMCIRDTMKEYKLKIINPFLQLHELFSSDITRDMRDFQHFLQMLDTYPIFYLFQRPIITIGKQKYLVITVEDVVRAKALFDEIAETTKTGTDKKILDFYHKFIQKRKEGAVLEKILESVNQDEEYKKNPMGDNTARFYLKRLNRLNWVQIKKGEVPTDMRRQTFYPLKDVDQKPEPQQKLSESSLKEKIKLDLKLKLQISFETWLKTSSLETPLHHTEIIKINGKEGIDKCEDISLQQFKQLIVGGTLPSTLLVSEHKETVKPETELGTSLKPEIKLVTLNPVKELETIIQTPNGSGALSNGNGESSEYKKQDQTAYVAHIVTGEPCYRKCGLASEWKVRIGSQFGEPEVMQFFCIGCWNKTKKELESSGFKIVFEDARQP